MDGDCVWLGAVVEADGAAGTPLSNILGGSEPLSVDLWRKTKELAGTGNDTAPAALAFVGIYLGIGRTLNFGLGHGPFAELGENT